MTPFFSACIWFFVAGFPLYLWAYAASRLDDNPALIRSRFWMGMISGAISVWLIYVLSRYNPDHDFFLTIVILWAFFVILSLVIWLSTGIGSVFSRIFVRRIARWHMLLIFILMLLLFFWAEMLFGSSLYAVLIIPILLASLFEESAKHLSTLWLLGKDFQFSRRDLAMFAFCVVLGFTFFENLLYFFHDQVTTTGLIFRSVFVFSAHLLSAMICTWAWWKALSYPLFSVSYLLVFFGWFLGATGYHALYNIALQHQSLGMLWFTLIVAYVLFTYLLVPQS